MSVARELAVGRGAGGEANQAGGERRPRVDTLVIVGAVLRYTAARAALFGVALGPLYLLGARGLLLLGLALLLSGLASYVLLSRQRDAMSSSLAGGLRRFSQRIGASTAAEDADGDHPRREHG